MLCLKALSYVYIYPILTAGPESFEDYSQKGVLLGQKALYFGRSIPEHLKVIFGLYYI